MLMFIWWFFFFLFFFFFNDKITQGVIDESFCQFIFDQRSTRENWDFRQSLDSTENKCKTFWIFRLSFFWNSFRHFFVFENLFDQIIAVPTRYFRIGNVNDFLKRSNWKKRKFFLTKTFLFFFWLCRCRNRCRQTIENLLPFFVSNRFRSIYALKKKIFSTEIIKRRKFYFESQQKRFDFFRRLKKKKLWKNFLFVFLTNFFHKRRQFVDVHRRV